jgi:hypothetical protein
MTALVDGIPSAAAVRIISPVSPSEATTKFGDTKSRYDIIGYS